MDKKFSLTQVGSAIVVVAIAGFFAGVLAQTTTFGTKVSELITRDNSEQTELPADLNYSEVEQVYDVLRKNYYGDLTEDGLIESLKEGIARATGDPYTVYLDAEAAKAFNDSLNNEFSGIGAEIAVKNDQLRVVAPLEGTPADKAGLRPGDLITAVDGETTEGITVEEAVTKIRGEKGTEVVLTVFRDNEFIDVSIVRDVIEVPNADGEILDGGIGYIDLDTFGNDSAQQVRALARDFASKNVKGIVLDLRGNSGGLLGASVDIAGLWLDNQVVVEQRGNEQGQLRSGARGELFGIPTVVLVNGGSASASEIVAGALQDHGAAEVIGEQTFGKGSVQTLEELPGGSQIKITIARWFTPLGVNIDKEGITPDKIVELTTEDFNADRDPQLDAALKLLKQ